MSPEAQWLGLLVVVGAAWLVAHLRVVWLGLRAADLEWRWRALVLLPPAAPIVAWRAGHRVAPVVWGVLLGLYVALRVVT